MHGRFRFALLVVVLILAAVSLSAQRTRGPMRVVLLVDSSDAMSTMLTDFRAGLNTLIDTLPDDVEVTLISTGGQIRVRVPPTTDHAVLRKAANSFASDGGANALLETLLECDKRFLKSVPDLRSVFIILTTDSGQWRSEQRIDAYNIFMHDFIRRGGRAHAIVIRGLYTGVTTDITSNLTENTGGYFDTIAIANAVPGRMKLLSEQFAADY